MKPGLHQVVVALALLTEMQVRHPHSHDRVSGRGMSSDAVAAV